MNDYERIASTIRYLDERRFEQPTLEVLAKNAGLSVFHFHRLFSRWAGVTPKDFLQCLTVTDVKRRLSQGQSALTASLDAGLSGPGRMHDLCVTLEGASPGEIKSGGAGWSIDAGFAESPFGTFLVAQGPRGICHLSFVEKQNKDGEWKELVREWPGARIVRKDSFARALASQIFKTKTKSSGPGDFRVFVKASPFQIRVWRALLLIPPGSLTSYGQLAATVGLSSAARAVGSAVGKNPLAYLIPCHRVIRGTGVIGEYRWGSLRKQTLLAWESSQK